MNNHKDSSWWSSSPLGLFSSDNSNSDSVSTSDSNAYSTIANLVRRLSTGARSSTSVTINTTINTTATTTTTINDNVFSAGAGSVSILSPSRSSSPSTPLSTTTSHSVQLNQGRPSNHQTTTTTTTESTLLPHQPSSRWASIRPAWMQWQRPLATMPHPTDSRPISSIWPIPDLSTYVSNSISNPTSNDPHKDESNVDSCLVLEYAALRSLAPTGVYVLPVSGAPTLWQGVIFVDEGVFQDGVFRFVVDAGEMYPTTLPTLRFTTTLFHPLVDPFTGELDLRSMFPDGACLPMSMVLILRYMKQVLVSGVGSLRLCAKTDHTEDVTLLDTPPLPRNLEAYRLLNSDYPAFLLRARKSVETSIRYIYEEPDSQIQFYPWDRDAHERALKTVLSTERAVGAIERIFSQNGGENDDSCN
ncbi:hypothetical protein BASA61_003311 [Batrachochytrium salamandrivorans]|nr:hypothetical protein BASA61_003311 [Batrachochytrium salamandrivorans]